MTEAEWVQALTVTIAEADPTVDAQDMAARLWEAFTASKVDS